MEGGLTAALQLQVAQGVRRRPLGAVLLADGRVTAQQLEEALLEVERGAGRLGEVLVSSGLLTPRELALALAAQAGLEFVDLLRIDPDPTAAYLLPEHFARRYQALPIHFDGDDVIVVAVSDPTDLVASDDLRLALGMQIRLVVVEAEMLATAITRIYKKQIEVVDEDAAPAPQPAVAEFDVGDTTTAPAIRVVNSIIGVALDEGASDIHLEPQREEMLVRARIDGMMRKVAVVPKALQAAVTSRLKVMGELDIAEKRAPQDGRITLQHEGQPVDLRIAVIPTTYGEQIVLRIFQRRSRLSLTDLGMSSANQETFERAIRQPYGAVIACGPTGSGKTTTLYAALDVLNESDRVLMTIEDPVEFQMGGVNQIEVNPKAGLTFARGLRTILRSDPDVLLVGEIRDDETAHIAIQAAMTGHLVLTTLHTHNAASSVERLKDMGVEPSLLASSVNCIVAQRLARRLCPNCKEEYSPTPDELERVEAVAEQTLFRATGCTRCGGTGYRGRVALYEVMSVRGQVRRLIGASTDDIFAAAVEDGMSTLRADGLRLVREGVSTLDEIRRVTGDRIV